MTVAVTANSRDAEGLFRSGLTLERAGDSVQAFDCYLRAIRLRPQHALAQHRAIQLLASLIALEPGRFGSVDRAHIPRTPAPEVSVVICSVDATKFTAVCENYHRLLEGWRHEIIGIHDARSLCEGFNRGFARARGDVIVFSHDDIEILSPHFAATLVTALAKHDVIGVAGSNAFPENGLWAPRGSAHAHGQVAHRVPGEKTYSAYVFGIGGAVTPGIQVLDGVFFAARREVVEKVRFDAEMFDGFHFYDIDFTYRASLSGFRVAVCNEICVVHHSRGRFGSEWRMYADRFLGKHPRRPTRAESPPRYWGNAIVNLRSPSQVVALLNALVVTAQRMLADPEPAPFWWRDGT